VDGEQYGWSLKERFDGHYIPITPLDRVRAELMARQYGLAPLFLPCNRGPNPWTPQLMRELLALMLPHGMRFWLAGHPETMIKVLDVVDAFDLPEARFVPYWSVPEWRRRAEGEGLVVSAYVRGGRAMLIVSNLRDQPREVKWRLEMEASGVGGQLSKVSDPLDNLRVSFQDGMLQLSVGGRDLRIVLLGSGGE
jgi:hypothetical protein